MYACLYIYTHIYCDLKFLKIPNNFNSTQQYLNIYLYFWYLKIGPPRHLSLCIYICWPYPVIITFLFNQLKRANLTDIIIYYGYFTLSLTVIRSVYFIYYVCVYIKLLWYNGMTRFTNNYGFTYNKYVWNGYGYGV